MTATDAKTRVVRGTAFVETPALYMSPYLWSSRRKRIERGRVRLEVDMPARPNPRGLLHPLMVLLIVGLLIGGVFWLLVRQAVLLPLIWFWIVGLVLTLGWWFFRLRPTAEREVLEICDRAVTLRRDSEYLRVWDRADFQDVSVASTENAPRVLDGSYLSGPPMIVWGCQNDRNSCLGGAGSELSDAVARQIVEEIDKFCLEHPRDSLVERFRPMSLL